jgi:hypothetical protein
MSSRLAKVVAITLLTFTGIAPAVASGTTPLTVTGVASTASATPNPGSGEVGDGHRRPNVGDDAPGVHEFGERRNILTDEGGLIALGLAALIGAATAILVLRSRRKSSLY